MDQDVRILERDFHTLGVGHEVRAEVAAIELHTLDHFELSLHGAGLFDGDDAVFTNLRHCSSDDRVPGSVNPELAEMVPTWAIMSPETGSENLLEPRRRLPRPAHRASPMMASTALSMPRFSAIGFAPAATVLTPSR